MPPTPPAQLPLIGTIHMWAGSWVPQGWLLCNGASYPIDDYTDLFTLIGATYGGDGKTTFCVPNLCARFPIGAGVAPGLANHNLGDSGGNETTTISVANIAPHTHVATVGQGQPAQAPAPELTVQYAAVKASSKQGATTNCQGNYFANAYNPAYSSISVNNYTNNPGTTGKIAGLSAELQMGMTIPVEVSGTLFDNNVGNGIPLNTMPRYLAINYIICVSGAIPSA